MPRDSKQSAISIVIPVYNEAEWIRACLQAVAAQTVPPLEVIVVDNNSTDETAAIAGSFPFVRIIREQQQGVAYARDAGFDAARGSLIARLDADTVLPADWVATATEVMQRHPQAAALSGKGRFYDFPYQGAISNLHEFVYQRLQLIIARTPMLWGSNMLIRNSAWQQIRQYTSSRTDIDEDIDLTFVLKERQLTVAYDSALLTDASLLRGSRSVARIKKYLSTWPRDYLLHGMRLRAGLIWCLMWLLVLGAVPLVLLVRLRGLRSGY